MDNYKQISKLFLEELRLASEGKPSSLPFLISNMPKTKLINPNETYEVLVIGGSIFEKALVMKKDQRVEVISKRTGPLPSFENKGKLFDFIKDLVDPSVRVLCINFAAPIKFLERNGKPDGILERSTKEHLYEDLVGNPVGEEIEKYFISNNRPLEILLANDSVCLLLAGLTINTPLSIAGLVVGTGYNLSFIDSSNKAVNIEAGEFNKFDPKKSTIYIDEQSINKGRYIFEKEISGGYLFKQYNFYNKINKVLSSTEELSWLALEGDPLAKEILMHSACMVASHVAGLAEYKKSNLVVVAEGSLFWKGFDYRDNVEKACKQLTSFETNFVSIEDSSIIGASMLAH